ncbi:glycoside hydrolase family 43 protein [Sphaerobolus stellatus SS14]|uniref:Glycoside hydrolase family 43 protein n=1 Tax=Sphaerobolus stellatus (strain SS14) TaxID=990650 RepID=A0A0C9VLL6_SPHS4|nr:glycoside hydrolase family 43 protein [Sphaerobolus stellatus SS14]
MVSFRTLLSGFFYGISLSSVGSLAGATISTLDKRVISGRYIFTSFTNSAQNQLYVWTSDDGTNFSKWASPVWSPPSGLLRDPSWILNNAEVLDGIPGNGLGYIDSFPIYYNNQYHLFTKSETSSKLIEHAVAPSLTGPYTFVQTGNFAGWG